MVAERGPKGEVFNAGPLNPTSIREVVERCAGALDIPFEELCEVTGDRLGQDSRYWLDSTALKNATGWEPQVDWDEGLAEMVEWGKRYLNDIRDWPTDYTLRA